ncbi:MAG: hypothetical protein GF398_09815 [Chitinivibrionales bacterium]|nr:hypothetical protein [Chitinivibrionales bacterium]
MNFTRITRLLRLMPLVVASCGSFDSLTDPDAAPEAILTIQGKYISQSSYTQEQLDSVKIGVIFKRWFDLDMDNTTFEYQELEPDQPTIRSDQVTYVYELGSFLNFTLSAFRLPLDESFTVTAPSGRKARIAIGAIVLFHDLNDNDILELSKDYLWKLEHDFILETTRIDTFPRRFDGSYEAMIRNRLVDTLVAVTTENVLLFLDDEGFLQERQSFARSYHEPVDSWTGVHAGLQSVKINEVANTLQYLDTVIMPFTYLKYPKAFEYSEFSKQFSFNEKWYCDNIALSDSITIGSPPQYVWEMFYAQAGRSIFLFEEEQTDSSVYLIDKDKSQPLYVESPVTTIDVEVVKKKMVPDFDQVLDDKLAAYPHDGVIQVSMSTFAYPMLETEFNMQIDENLAVRQNFLQGTQQNELFYVIPDDTLRFSVGIIDVVSDQRVRGRITIYSPDKKVEILGSAKD